MIGEGPKSFLKIIKIWNNQNKSVENVDIFYMFYTTKTAWAQLTPKTAYSM